MPVAETSLSDWLERLEALNPDRIEPGLERIRPVWERMGRPVPGQKRIVVAGTNGKGSCVETMRRLGESLGLSVGCYTSPHLRHFNERIRLPAGPAEDDVICRAFEAVDGAKGEIRLSWFEFTTLAALHLLCEAGLDLALLEIGLGGRLDAVNLMNGDVAVVTGIDLDHCQWLGPDRESIGSEKAAVYRSSKPAVCGDSDPPGSLLRQIANTGAHPVLCDEQYSWKMAPDGWSFEMGELRLTGLPVPALPLSPCSAGLAAFLQLFPDTSQAQIKRAFCGLSLAGRGQKLNGHTGILLDVAHNPQATAYLSARVRELPQPGRVHWVFGASRDKDLEQLAAPVIPLGGCWYPVAAGGARSASQAGLADMLLRAGMEVCPAGASVAEGLTAALNSAGEEDMVVVFGSFYVVGEAMDWAEQAGYLL